MYSIAVETQPVSLSKLREQFTPSILSSDFIEALESLKRRSLIENFSGNFIQKPVLMEYINNRLIGQRFQNKSSELLSL